MARVPDNNDTRLIKKKLKEIQKNHSFFHFSDFFVVHFLPEKEQKTFQNIIQMDYFDSEEEKKLYKQKEERLRRMAYLAFCQQISVEELASYNTVRLWFGIEKKVVPKRIQIFRLAILMQLSEEELSEYLVEGLLEPDVQINDYREMIYLYGLTNGLSVKQCDDMIACFAGQLEDDMVFEQRTQTEQVWRLYREHQKMNQDEFLQWMKQIAGMLKGYSKVALNHFLNLKKQILSFVRKDAEWLLRGELEECGFFEWMTENGISKEDEKDSILRFIKNRIRRQKDKLHRRQFDRIRELYWMAYDSQEKNTDMLAELYAAAMEKTAPAKRKRIQYRKKEEFILPADIIFMTEKHVSQLMGIASQKERLMRLESARYYLEGREEQEPCPENLSHIIAPKSKKENMTVGEAKKQVKVLLKHQEQRCELVGRMDLLPLIHYVAQRNYQIQIEEEQKEYNREDAIRFFVEFADWILKDCQMEQIDEKYQLDYLLLSGFGKMNMYSLSEIIEVAELDNGTVNNAD